MKDRLISWTIIIAVIVIVSEIFTPKPQITCTTQSQISELQMSLDNYSKEVFNK